MRTVLICHEEEPLNRVGLARWLASFSHLAGIVSISEPRKRVRRRIRREIERVGCVRFLDVLAFRLYYRLRLAKADQKWENSLLSRLCEEYAAPGADTLVHRTGSPNRADTEEFIRGLQPDMIIARCKTLLAPRVFQAARLGTFVMHPGICPEYRNAHGCFWALARRDPANVGMTLLKVDRGIDTGPVYGYFRVPFDSLESHIIIQHRSVFENLPALRSALEAVFAGRAMPVDTGQRASREWGQPWLSEYLALRARGSS